MKLSVLALIACILVTVSQAESRVYLDVYGQSYKRITIATPPFKGDTAQPATQSGMKQLLDKDLDLSGFFIVAPPSVIDAELTSEGTERKDIRFENWRSVGVDLICKGRLHQNAEGLDLEAFLYDSSDGMLLFAKKYKGGPDEWRKIVNRLADDIVLAVTGEKGILSSKVLFVSGGGRSRDVYISSLDGSEMRRLTSYNHLMVSPALSPDGKYLAFTSYKEGRPHLYVIDLQRGREVYVNREDGMKNGVTWVDNKRIAYAHISGKYSTIYCDNVETKEHRVILRKDGILTSPSFTRDGKKMVFVSDMYGTPQVFSKDIDNSDIRRLSRSGGYNTSPVISPKGDLIAFVSKIGGSFEICVMKPDGSEQRALTNGGINDSPRFSSCGRYIIYSLKNGGRGTIRLMLLNGDNKKMLNFTGAEEGQPSFIQ
jgi:TolB protein